MHSLTGASPRVFFVSFALSSSLCMAPAMALEKGAMAPDFELPAASGNLSTVLCQGNIAVGCGQLKVGGDCAFFQGNGGDHTQRG